MSDLERLLEGEADPLERSLLEAAKDEDDDRARAERTLAALGLGGPGPGPAPGDGGTGGAAAGGGTAGGAALKWLALAMVGGAVAVGVAVRGEKGPPTSPSAPIAVTTKAKAPPVPSAAPTVSAPASPEPPASAAPPAPRVPSAPVVTTAPPAPKPAGTGDLKREIAALDRARSAIREGDAARAKKELDRYDFEFPFGSLAPEAKALRARLQKMSGSGKKQ